MAKADDNPFESPASNLEHRSGTGVTDDLTIDILAQTRPWVTLLCILGMISVGLLILGTGFGAIGAILNGKTGFDLLFPVLFLVLAFITALPIYYLRQYSKEIGILMASATTDDLNAALTAQKSFWKTTSIMTVVLTAVYVGLVIRFAIKG